MSKPKKLLFFGNEINIERGSTNTNDFLKYYTKSSFEIISQRSTAFQKTIEIGENEVLEIEFEDGLIRIMTLDQLAEEFPKETLRSSGVQLKADEIILPIHLNNENQSRGIFKNIIKGLKVIFLSEKIENIAATALAKKIENNLPYGEGLYYCQDPNNLGEMVKKLSIEKPILLLIHGTASNTQSSFGGLVSNNIPSSAWSKLQKKYGNQIVAFEHKTLSKSPLQNAIEILETLPKNAIIHLITHSRGGLVGEILSRNLTDRSNAFSEVDLKIFSNLNREEDVKASNTINTLFKEKRIQVTKFVRVACPTSGTTLASKRLDQYFTVILNLIGLVPILKVSPIYRFVKSFLIAFVKQKANIDTLPGLEAMMPDAPLIKILNNAGQKIKSELFIISGDVKASGIKHSLAVLVSDAFYRTKHDFVVNTASMFGGSRRDDMHYTFYSNKDVSHFSYFINKPSQDDIATALTSPNELKQRFKKLVDGLLDPDEELNTRSALDYVNPSKESIDINLPFVYIIPGIMGSKLKASSDRIWVNPFRLALGGMQRLKMGAPDIEPFQVMGSAYKDLIKALKEKNNVVPFPYDWRVSIVDAAYKLAEDLEERMKISSQPIRLLAHSMGGLVVHAMFSDSKLKETWKKLMNRPGARVIFLGTPFKGSHMIPSVFLKKNKAFKTLHRLDLTNSSKDILNIIKEYTGLLQLLPVDATHDFFDIKVWNQLGISEKDFVKPLTKELKKAKELSKLLKANPIDKEGVVYIAGKDRHTPCGLKFNNSKASLIGTSLGDGSVTWETGIPKNLETNTWYMEATHGELCASKKHFPAIFDLLETGTTTLLDQNRITHRGEVELFEMPEEISLSISTERAFEYAIMGLDPNLKLEEPKNMVNIEICHGDLGNAMYPVAVGHHLNDPIVSAEMAVDHYMENQLSKNKELGIYPGALETSLVLLNENSHFKGAIVIGLGEYGTINQGKLTRTFTHALLDYAMKSSQGLSCETELKNKVIGVSTILIASDYSGLSIRNSIRAMLEGVIQANKLISASNNKEIPLIENIQFIEIFKDRAIKATHELLKIIKEPLFFEKVNIKRPYVKRVSGRRRRIADNQTTDWWYRLKIEGKGEALKFTSLTDKARAEEEIKSTQRTLIDNLIESSVQSYSWNEDNARTLFHLLIPNDFKDYTTDNKNLLLIVDDESAQYPWEILHLPNVKRNSPLVTQIGLIRQLVTKEYDRVVNSTLENRVLIIANPKTTSTTTSIEKYPLLPHAEEEGKAVNKIFEEHLFTTNLSIQDTGVTVINKLFGKDYKVIHLAGHGIVDESNPERTGMVLDHNMYIKSAEIDALPNMPELVFINCCYLGKKVDTQTKFNKLAANLGTQFIRKGVKAVVAAGWAIDDAAAKHFAEEFYKALFKGETFGDAVRLARSSTHNNYRNSNTWGAYQCYGDPFYRLITNIKSVNKSKTIYVDALEVIVDLENIKSKAEPASSRDREGLIEKVFHIITVIKKQKETFSNWLNNSKVVEAIADCFYELNEYDEALKYYKMISSLLDGQTTLESMLRLANIQTKIAVKKLRQSDIKENEVELAWKEINESEKIIQNLIEIGENSRRYSTKGGHFKRKALICKLENQQKNNDVEAIEKAKFDFTKKSLEISLKAYQKACDFVNDEQRDYYAIINWSTLETIYHFYGGDRKVALKNVRKQIDLIRVSIGEQKGQGSFWFYIFPAALEIHDLLYKDRNINDRKEMMKNIINIYKKNWFKGGSHRKAENILGQIEFLIGILSKRLDFSITKVDRSRIENIVKTLNELKYQLKIIFKENKA